MAIRQDKLLIDYLLDHKDYVSSKELSDLLHVSTKTVSRTIKQINNNFRHEQLILAMKGKPELFILFP